MAVFDPTIFRKIVPDKVCALQCPTNFPNGPTMSRKIFQMGLSATKFPANCNSSRNRIYFITGWQGTFCGEEMFSLKKNRLVIKKSCSNFFSETTFQKSLLDVFGASLLFLLVAVFFSDPASSCAYSPGF